MKKSPEDAWAEVRGGMNLSYIADNMRPPLTRAAVSAWSRVPAERVPEVSRLTGIARERLRPDIYLDDDPWSAI